MELAEFEQHVGKYKRFEYISSDNPLVTEEYLSYSLNFSSLKVYPCYPPLVVLKNSRPNSSFAIWNVYRVYVEHSENMEYDTVKCVSFSPHVKKETPVEHVFRAYKI